jgi:hypothetical protein
MMAPLHQTCRIYLKFMYSLYSYCVRFWLMGLTVRIMDGMNNIKPGHIVLCFSAGRPPDSPVCVQQQGTHHNHSGWPDDT